MIEELTKSKYKIESLEALRTKEKEDFLSQVISYTGHIEELTRNIEELKSKIEFLQNTNNILQEDNNKLNKKHAVYKREIRNLIKGVKDKNKKISSLEENHKKEIEKLLNKQRQEIETHQKVQTSTEALANKANARVEKLDTQLSILKREKEDLSQQLESMNAELANKIAELENLKTNLELYQTMNKDFESQINDKNREIDKLKQTPLSNPATKKGNSDLKTKVENLERHEKQLIEKFERVQKLMNQVQEENDKTGKKDEQTIWEMHDKITELNNTLAKLASEKKKLTDRVKDLMVSETAWKDVSSELQNAVLQLSAREEKNKEIIAYLSSQVEELKQKIKLENQEKIITDNSKEPKESAGQHVKLEQENKKLRELLKNALNTQAQDQEKIKDLEKKLKESEEVRNTQRSTLLGELENLIKDPQVKKLAPPELQNMSQRVFKIAPQITPSDKGKKK